jgi:hypothetical protein
MNPIRIIARYSFPSEKQMVRWYRRLAPPGNKPKWLEPALWSAMSALLLAL